jgi:ABC-type branched-subunit amino acid transport system substrate-binding protein
MKRIWLLGLAVAFVVFAALSGIAWSESPKTLDIGIATPLTGPAANVGSNYRNGVLLAVDAWNAKGGVTIAGQKYMLNPIIRDTKFNPTTAKTVAEELVYDKKVKIIFGTSQVDMSGMQATTEENKVIVFSQSPYKEGSGPNKPFTFFLGGYPEKMYALGALRMKKYYPQATKVASVYADLPDAPTWTEAAKNACAKFGFTWLGMEKYPANTTDFSAVIARILAKKPDVVDTSASGGAMGAVLPILVKQLRQAGFEGLIWMPTVPPPGVMTEAVPKQYLYKILTNDVDLNSPVVTKAYKDLYALYVSKFKAHPINLMFMVYDGASAVFEFLNTQSTMDTTTWVRGLEKFQWKSVYGQERRWVGKPILGVDRFFIDSLWVSEWKDGVVQNTQEVEKFPWEWFESR